MIPRRAGQKAWRDPDAMFWPMAAVGILFAAQFSLIFTRPINWDEFVHYGQLYDLWAGRPLGGLQTLYLRPYQWIAGSVANGVDGVIVARVGQWLCEGIILGGIWLAARHFTDAIPAMFCALAYLSVGHVLQHGFALRADPMTTAVLMSALALLIVRRLDWLTVLGCGAFIGLAGMLSIKAVLYAPAFAGVAWLRIHESGRSYGAAMKLAAVPVVAAIAFAAVWAAHTMAMPARPDNGQSEALAEGAARYMFFVGQINNLGSLISAVLTGLPLYAAALAAPFAIARRRGSKAEAVALGGMLAMVLWPFVYENTAPYFYVFMLAPVAVAIAPAMQIARRVAPAMILAVLMIALAVPTIALDNRSVIHNQRRLLASVAALVPTGTSYFDHADMIAPLVKRNSFQSPWGIKVYRAAGTPQYRQEMERDTVPLLLANWHTLLNTMNGSDEFVVPEDGRALRDNYVQFDGPIFLAGKRVEAGPARVSEFLVPGTYTVRDAPVRFDGRAYGAGELVQVTRGPHVIGTSGRASARLIWGDRLEPGDGNGLSPSWVSF